MLHASRHLPCADLLHGCTKQSGVSSWQSVAVSTQAAVDVMAIIVVVAGPGAAVVVAAAVVVVVAAAIATCVKYYFNASRWCCLELCSLSFYASLRVLAELYFIFAALVTSSCGHLSKLLNDGCVQV
ncbi:unnamed protein product [Toxocara canis]|uniref:Transmembrane protein n=1 Tax=Toxocara canis TaxID=6265 RepID=A0A183U0S2_TOXCA|nr:unnamed protein product [Toxocara canis]